MVTNMATAVPLVRSGRLKGLAVTSARCANAVPELPTAAEAGVPGYDYTTWYGMLAPAGISPPLLSRINRDVAAVLRSAQVTERFGAQGLDVQPSSPAEFAAYIKSEIAKWGKVIRTAGIKPE